MSIVYAYMAVEPDVLERCRREAAYVGIVLYDDPFGDWEEDDWDAPMPLAEADVAQFWDALWFLLSEQRRSGSDRDYVLETDPAALAVIGAEPVHMDHLDRFIQYLDADGVVRADAALQSLERDAVLARIDREAMNAHDVYPGGWETFPTDSIGDQLDTLTAFYRTAAEQGAAVIVYRC